MGDTENPNDPRGWAASGHEAEEEAESEASAQQMHHQVCDEIAADLAQDPAEGQFWDSVCARCTRSANRNTLPVMKALTEHLPEEW